MGILVRSPWLDFQTPDGATFSLMHIKIVSKVLEKMHDTRTSYIASAPLQTTSQVDKDTKNVFNAVMFDECVIELGPEMATRGSLIHLISAFLHILSVVLH